MPYIKRKVDGKFCVYKRDADGNPTGDSLGCHASESEADDQIAAIHANESETEQGAIDVANVMETTVIEGASMKFAGLFPDIKIADGVDLRALQALDDDPVFVTLPVVPKVGTVSANGLLYDDALLRELESQIISRRPGANFGHIPAADRDTAFPKPDAIWVGAQRVGDTLWAKAYVRPGAARDYIRTLKAVGGSISTSIFGKGRHEKLADGVRRLKQFNLETLDFAPPTRAALGGGATPYLTAEMSNEHDAQSGEIDMPTKEEVLAELTIADIPSALREQIVADATQAAGEAERIAELTEAVGDRDTQIAELTATIDEYKRAAFGLSLDTHIAELMNWNVTGEKAKQRFDAFRKTLRSRVIAELDGRMDEEAVNETLSQVWEELKPIAETLRDALAGPPAVVSTRAQRTLDTSPAAMAAARAKFNFGN